MKKIIVHVLVVAFLTLLTQVGGVLWIVNYSIFTVSKSKKSWGLKLFSFAVIYVFSTLLIIPPLAKLNDRVPLPITKSGNLAPHNIMMPLLNRHYVRPDLKQLLFNVGEKMNSKNRRLKIVYLDANFPFMDGFPLLPHLSHKDGRKVDLSFVYKKENEVVVDKPSNTGYGVFVEPLDTEMDQSVKCRSNGYWQYDYARYFTLGSTKDLTFDMESTKYMIQLLTKDKTTKKIFLEPHLKSRLNLKSKKVRYHGCHSVRHDDHLHLEI